MLALLTLSLAWFSGVELSPNAWSVSRLDGSHERSAFVLQLQQSIETDDLSDLLEPDSDEDDD